MPTGPTKAGQDGYVTGNVHDDVLLGCQRLQWGHNSPFTHWQNAKNSPLRKCQKQELLILKRAFGAVQWKLNDKNHSLKGVYCTVNLTQTKIV